MASVAHAGVGCVGPSNALHARTHRVVQHAPGGRLTSPVGAAGAGEVISIV
jgi:hypothetical protein